MLLFTIGWTSGSTACTFLLRTLSGYIVLDVLWIVSALDGLSFVYHVLHAEEVHCIKF